MTSAAIYLVAVLVGAGVELGLAPGQSTCEVAQNAECLRQCIDSTPHKVGALRYVVKNRFTRPFRYSTISPAPSLLSP